MPMPTGTIIKQQLSINTAIIAGIVLASQESATIVFSDFQGATEGLIVLPPGLRLPIAAFDGQAIPPRFLVEVSISPESAGGFTNLQPSVAVTGSTEADCRITVTNTNTSEATQTLLIRIRVGEAEVANGGAQSVVVDLRGAQDVEVNL